MSDKGKSLSVSARLVKEHLHQSRVNGPEFRVSCPYPTCNENWSYPANFKILDKPLHEGIQQLTNIMKICCVHLAHAHFYAQYVRDPRGDSVLTCWCGFKFTNRTPYLSNTKDREYSADALWQEMFDHFVYHGGMKRHYRLSIAKQALIEDTHNG